MPVSRTVWTSSIVKLVVSKQYMLFWGWVGVMVVGTVQTFSVKDTSVTWDTWYNNVIKKVCFMILNFACKRWKKKFPHKQDDSYVYQNAFFLNERWSDFVCTDAWPIQPFYLIFNVTLQKYNGWLTQKPELSGMQE